MDELSSGEQNLVALGAALGSNCVPCAEHYVGEARKGGFTDQQIHEAIRLADGVRRVPAQKVLDRAIGMLSKTVTPETKPTPEAERTDQGRETAAEGKPDSTGTASQGPHPDRKRCCCYPLDDQCA